MGLFSTFFNSLINPIEETVKTIVGMYRMAGTNNRRHNLRDVLFHRQIAAKKIGNPYISEMTLLSRDDFFDVINDDLALFIFVLLMVENDTFNKNFTNNPHHYFAKIESEVIKNLHTYTPNRDTNYFKSEFLAINYSRYNSIYGY